jgi:hypothetical protein
VFSHGTREGKPEDETRDDVLRLRSGAKAPLRTIRKRWSIANSGHWVRDVPLREDVACYRKFNGFLLLATRPWVHRQLTRVAVMTARRTRLPGDRRYRSRTSGPAKPLALQNHRH